MGTIKIKGYAKEEVNADIVDISITFKAKNAKVADALEEVKKQSETFLKEMSNLGMDICGFHLENDKTSTEGYNEEKYKVASRTVSTKCDYNPKVLNAMLGIIAKNKLEAEISTDYSYSKQEELENKLLQAAINNSRGKANSLAVANNQTVKYAESISDDRDDCYGKRDYRDFKCGFVGDILLDEDLLSNKLSAKPLQFSETIYVTWVIE